MSLSVLFMMNEHNDLVVNKAEAKKIKEYATLFARDKGSTGDSVGKLKLVACAEIYYIYLVYDVRSIYYNLPLDERKMNAKRDSKLPSNWKEDEELNAAVIRYKEDFKLSATGKAYVSAERAYYSICSDTEDLQDNIIELKALMKVRLNKLTADKNKPTDLEAVTITKEVGNIMAEIIKNQEAIIKNVKTYSALGNTVKELATKFVTEGGNLRMVVGGGVLGNREE